MVQPHMGGTTVAAFGEEREHVRRGSSRTRDEAKGGRVTLLIYPGSDSMVNMS